MTEFSGEFYVDYPGKLTRRDKRQIRDTQNIIAHMKKAGLFDLDKSQAELALEPTPTPTTDAVGEVAVQLVLFNDLNEVPPEAEF